MITWTQYLIESVNSGSSKAVAHALSVIKNRPKASAQTDDYLHMMHVVNGGLPGNNLTALHFACFAYANSETDASRKEYELICDLLVDNGAQPSAFADSPVKGGEKVTPISLCNGKIPPNLMRRISEKAHKNMEMARSSVSIRKRAERAGMGEQDYMECLGGYNF